MNDVEHDLPDSLQTDFPSLMDWDEVIQDDREDRLGFARRTTYALLTLSGAELVEGFDGGNRRHWKRPEGRWRCSRHTCGGKRGSRKRRRSGWGALLRFLLLPGSRSCAASTTL